MSTQITTKTVVKDEGSLIPSNNVINFTGAGVSVSNVGGEATIDIPGGGGGGVQSVTGIGVDNTDPLNPVVDIPSKTSDLINDGDDGVSHFISLNDLPSNIILYPTNVASDVPTYFKLVSSITDLSFNTVAVDIPTGAITTTNQLISSLVTTPNIIVGNPGVFNITTIGNIRRISGTGTASFYFKVYKRTSGGTETLIATSDNTIPVLDGGIYTEFSATGLWNDGIFADTDRVVMKYFANRISGGSNPTYEFQFGGVTPVRTAVPIPLTVVPGQAIYTITASAQIDTTSNTDVVATGLEITPPAGTYKIDFNGHYLSIPGNVVQIATLDLQTLTLYINNLTATGTHGLSFGSGETLTAGVYDVAGAMSVAGVLTLNGGPNDIFVFRSAGALNTASFTSVLLTGGVKSANVFFLANGALGLGANNVLSGNFISVGSAGALGADATFNGRLLSTAGSLAFGAGSISKPTDVSLLPIGILESFLGFTNGGGIQNTALATITGNLGTGSAAVVIFTGSVFNGVSFDVTQPLGDTNVFSLYIGNTQIPHTERIRYFNTYVEDVALMATATVNGTESISVRWRTDIGKVILANRILTIV